MVYGESAKGLLLLKISKLIKNQKRRSIKLKKLYEANKWWNDCKFQLHWKNIEWVNPITITKGNKPFSFYS